MSNDIPYFYLFIYSKLKDSAWNEEYLDTAKVLNTIRHDCRQLPNNLIYHMLSQMESYGLVKRIHRFKYKIVDKKIDLQGFDKRGQFSYYGHYSKKKDDYQKALEIINKEGKIKCEDDCLYKILPSKELKKLNELNCWFVKA